MNSFNVLRKLCGITFLSKILFLSEKSCIFALTFSNFAYYMSRKQQKDVTLQKIWAR